MPTTTPQLDARTLRWMPWVIAIAFFMQSLDGTILNTALPSMARSLSEDPLRMQSVIIAYMLTIALLIPASGWISDRFGIKRIFFSAILLFSFGSLLCAAANSLGMLVAARVVQGLGGALMMPVGRLIVLRAYPRTELVRTLSFITMPALLRPLLGPTVGGWLVEYLSWHWIFLINVPLGILAVLGFALSFPTHVATHRHKIDWAGAAMLSVFLLGYSFVAPISPMADDGRGPELASSGQPAQIAPIVKPVNLRARFTEVIKVPYDKVWNFDRVPLRLRGAWSTACNTDEVKVVLGERELIPSEDESRTPLTSVWQTGQRYGLVREGGSVDMVAMISADRLQKIGTMNRHGEFIADTTGAILNRCL